MPVTFVMRDVIQQLYEAIGDLKRALPAQARQQRQAHVLGVSSQVARRFARGAAAVLRNHLRRNLTKQRSR